MDYSNRDDFDGKLTQARALARMYPIAVQSSGGLKLNGVDYVWDFARQELYPEAELKALAKEDMETRKAEEAAASRDQVSLDL